VSRRDFLQRVGRTAAGLYAVSGIAACGGGDGGGTTSPPNAGVVRGIVVDVQGAPQPGFGVLILMDDEGRHTGARVTPDAAGRFKIDALAAGEYQFRFHAAGQAIIPEPYQHPIKFTVVASATTELTIRVQRGTFNQNQVEIYCGDDFYQLQPDGAENGETVVKLGTVVCWYNVGKRIHTVTGGPWNDSGDMQKTQSYIWVANQLGLFGYRCVHSQPQMQATLRVIAAA
jgi:hypothetical protein